YLTTKKSLIELCCSPFATIFVVSFSLCYKTIKIVSIQIFTHIILALMMLWYDNYEYMGVQYLVYIFGFFLSLSNISAMIVVYSDYVSCKSSLENRTMRFLLLTVSQNAGIVIGETTFGFLIKYVGFSYSF
ncbi:hypothetical protein MXB_4860, partial [Myxobolus squamalis]